MDLILHCGDSKTGSSSIQNFLYDNSSALLKDGILYYASHLRNHNDFMYLVGKKARISSEESHEEKLDQSLSDINEIKVLSKEYKPKFIIISGESFFHFNENEINNFIKKLNIKFDNIYCLIYIRCPVSHYVSLIQQTIKASHKFPNPYTFKRDIYSPVNRWCNFVGYDNFILGIFDKKLLKNNCVVCDFGQKLEKITGVSIDVENVIRANESIGVEPIILLQQFRRDFLSEYDNIFHDESNRLLRFFLKICSEEILPITKAELKKEYKDVVYLNNIEFIDKIEQKLNISFKNSLYFCKPPDNKIISYSEIHDIGELFYSFNSEIYDLLKRCIPNYNVKLKYSLDDFFLSNKLTKKNKKFFLEFSYYLLSEHYKKAAEQSLIHLIKIDPKCIDAYYLLSRLLVAKKLHKFRIMMQTIKS